MASLFIAWAKAERGIVFYQIPYKNTVQALQGAVAGDVMAAAFAAGGSVPTVKAGKIRALAVTGNKRSVYLPDLPTIKEAGYDFDYSSWLGMFTVAGTPREIVRRLNVEVAKLLADPAFHGKFIAPLGVEIDEFTAKTPEEFAEFIRQDRERLAKLVAIAGIQKQ